MSKCFDVVHIDGALSCTRETINDITYIQTILECVFLCMIDQGIHQNVLSVLAFLQRLRTRGECSPPVDNINFEFLEHIPQYIGSN